MGQVCREHTQNTAMHFLGVLIVADFGWQQKCVGPLGLISIKCLPSGVSNGIFANLVAHQNHLLMFSACWVAGPMTQNLNWLSRGWDLWNKKINPILPGPGSPPFSRSSFKKSLLKCSPRPTVSDSVELRVCTFGHTSHDADAVHPGANSQRTMAQLSQHPRFKQ